MDIDIDMIRQIAQQELFDEHWRAAINREKQRITALRNQSLWQRLLSKLPFTITIERKKP